MAMKFPVTLAALKADPAGFAAGVFGPGGIASRIVPGFKVSVAQQDYAANLAAAGARGLDPAAAGAVTLTEASTGVGKTVAYCVVGMTYALLTEKRFLVSTYTRNLMHQLVGGESALVLAILREVLGFEGNRYGDVEAILAPRRSRSAFVSPSRARRAADELRRETDGDKAAAAAIAAALTAYADLAQEALDRASTPAKADAMVTELAGLVESFDALDPERADLVRKVPANAYVLTSDCPEAEQQLYKAYDRAAQKAVGLVVTHASLLIDASLFGRLTKASTHGFAMAVVDEAHDLQRAAASAFGRRLSLRAGLREATGIVRQVQGGEVGDAEGKVKKELVKAAKAYEAAYADLVREVDAAVEAIDVERDTVIAKGDEAWVRQLLNTSIAQDALIKALERSGGEHATAMVADMNRDKNAIKLFFDCLDWRKEHPGKVGLFLPQLALSPRRRDPCIQVTPVKGQRIVQRLWNRTEARGPWADAVVFTSATLATGKGTDYAAFEGQVFNYGIDKDTPVNRDLCKVFEAAHHGVPRFVFADPEAPYMTNQGERKGLVTEAGARYLALALLEAHGRRNPSTGGARILIPTNSHADAIEIGRFVPEPLRHLVVVREPGTSLQTALRQWREIPDGILITPGAHQGVNEPGLVDHLMVYRLPYDPPRRPDGENLEGFLNMRAEMLTKFRQTIGRAVRRPDDTPTIWLLDVRVGLPSRVEKRLMLLSDDRADKVMLGAFPKRYDGLLARGEVFPCPDALKQSRRTHQPRNEEEMA